MRTMLLLPFLFTGCQPLTPEGRAYVMGNINAQAQRDHEYAMQQSANTQMFRPPGGSYFNNPYGSDYPTYYVRPDPLWPGGVVVRPR